MDFVQASFEDAVFELGYMWIFDNQVQGICKINISTFEMEIISLYVGKEKFAARRIFSIQDKLYIASGVSADILVYDKKIQRWDSELYPKELLRKDVARAYEIFAYENNIYFFPIYANKKIICFEICSQRYSSKEIFEANIMEKIGAAYMSGFSLYKGTVWFGIYGTPLYVKYDLVKGKAELFHSSESDAALETVCFDGRSIWMTKVNCTDVICEDRQVIKILDRQSYSRLYDIGNYIITCPKYSNKLVLVEKETFKVIVINMPFSEDEKQRQSGGSNIVNCREYFEHIFFFPHGIKAMFVLDQKTFEIRRIQLKCEDYIDRCFKKERVLIMENDSITLENLLQFCRQDSCSAHEEKKNSVGESIWKAL